MKAAARLVSKLSGSLTIALASTITWPAKAPSPVMAITRSPGRMPSTPSPTVLTRPATSPPGVNGGGILIWYVPCTNRPSTKLTPAASTSITTRPGSATNGSTSWISSFSGGPHSVQTTVLTAQEPTGGGGYGRRAMTLSPNGPGAWREPARDLPVIGHPDVLVVGAGSAGIAAALAAARRGADTWLIERGSWVGGLATLGLINLLLTMDDGDGHQVVAGLCQEFVDRMDSAGAAQYPPSSEWNDEASARVDEWRGWGLVWGAPPEAVRYSVAFDPEAFIDVSYAALAAAGVHLRLHTAWAAAYTGERSDGRITSIVVESKAGREVIQPTV